MFAGLHLYLNDLWPSVQWQISLKLLCSFSNIDWAERTRDNKVTLQPRGLTPQLVAFFTPFTLCLPFKLQLSICRQAVCSDTVISSELSVNPFEAFWLIFSWTRMIHTPAFPRTDHTEVVILHQTVGISLIVCWNTFCARTSCFPLVFCFFFLLGFNQLLLLPYLQCLWLLWLTAWL